MSVEKANPIEAKVKEERSSPAVAERASWLEAVELPTSATAVVLASGRRYELASDGRTDVVTVRARGGEIVVSLAIGARGPVLRCTAAELEIEAAETLALSAKRVAVRASEALSVEAGSVEQRVAGHRHSRVGGEERLEAGAIALQANARDVELRAMGRIALDGEHIGLNDDPCPAPFAWSEVGHDEP